MSRDVNPRIGRGTPFLHLFEPTEQPLVKKVFRSGLLFKSTPQTLLSHARLTTMCALSDPTFTAPTLHVYKKLKVLLDRFPEDAFRYARTVLDQAQRQEVAK